MKTMAKKNVERQAQLSTTKWLSNGTLEKYIMLCSSELSIQIDQIGIQLSKEEKKKKGKKS